jgi:hypothetical protein
MHAADGLRDTEALATRPRQNARPMWNILS